MQKNFHFHFDLFAISKTESPIFLCLEMFLEWYIFLYVGTHKNKMYVSENYGNYFFHLIFFCCENFEENR